MSDSRSASRTPYDEVRAVIDRGIPVNTDEWVDVINACNRLIEFTESFVDATTELAREEVASRDASLQNLRRWLGSNGYSSEQIANMETGHPYGETDDAKAKS